MESVFEFNWTIENFNYFKLPTGEAIRSPVFAADTPYKTHWRLKLYPRGVNDPNFLSCYLECHNHNENRERIIDFWIGILGTNACSVVSQSLENIRFQKGVSAGFPELVTLEDLKKNRRHYLPKGTLTIRCYLRTVLPNPTDEDLFSLSETFKKVYVNRDFTNLKLQSGKDEFPVHREILCARASTLTQNFGLVNSGSWKASKYRSKISVGNIPADTLNALLLYLYSGVLETEDFQNWIRLYELFEKYELFDMQRDIFPTPTVSYLRTKIHRMTKSIIFPIKNFCTSLRCTLGVLINFDFARVGTEYFVSDDQPIDRVGIVFSCFMDDPDATEQLFCSISVLDVDGISHYTSVHEIKYYASPNFVLYLNIMKEWLMNDSFLSGDTLRLKFKFTVVGELEPIKIEVMKQSKALCLKQKPSYLTLSRLSEDLEQLVRGDTIAILNPNLLKHEADLLQKAVFSAWSPVYAELLQDSQNEKNTLCINTETVIGELLFRFLYTGRIGIPSFKTASCLYSVAQMYQIDSLRQISLRSMTSKLSKDTVIGALIFAYTYGEEELYASSQNFVCSCKDIFCSDEWKSLSTSYPYIVKEVMTQLNNKNLNAMTSAFIRDELIY